LVWLGVSGVASKTDDLEQVLRQNLRLRCELGVAVAEAEVEEAQVESNDADLAKLRLELKLRRATDPASAKEDAESQREERRAGSKEPQERWLRVVSRAWGIVGLIGLATSLAALWLIYG
jgi:hypothetical protein